MRILLLCHSFNCLTQRLFVELAQAGHEISVEFDVNDATAIEAATMFEPDIVVAPFLKRAIAESVWRRTPCLVVHPGIPGDRGPSALDWAILENETEWGVTVLQANAVMDGGDIWSSREFAMRQACKASLYRREVTRAAVVSVLEAVTAHEQGDFKARPLDYSDPRVRGRPRQAMSQSMRAIDWSADDTSTVLRKIRSADGYPGLRDVLCGRELYLYDAHPAEETHGRPGDLVARSGNAVCRATTDGAVWIGHARDRQGDGFKLPAVRVLQDSGIDVDTLPDIRDGYREIVYEERGRVGMLHFDFYNGAMGADQCRALLDAYREAQARPTRVIVLSGGPEFWSNGMHLNLIEAADSPADASFENINAIDDLARAIITTETHLTVAALRGNAGAGGVFLARAADLVWSHGEVVLNPHYKDMGNLYGSEYWTYLLPRFAGDDNAARIMRSRLPMGIREALRVGLIDEGLGELADDFIDSVWHRAAALAEETGFKSRLDEKIETRRRDERDKPLSRYRDEELERMRLNFYGFDSSYHVARYNFVHKVPKSRTPLTLARHRSGNARARNAC
jgi:putative two-component system hydrogenase maturation factor HypX/HoxX